MLGLGSGKGRARGELRLAEGDTQPGSRARGARKTAMRPQHGTFGSPRMPSESSTVLVPARAPLSACVLKCFGYEYLGAEAPTAPEALTAQVRLLLGLRTRPACPAVERRSAVGRSPPLRAFRIWTFLTVSTRAICSAQFFSSALRHRCASG